MSRRGQGQDDQRYHQEKQRLQRTKLGVSSTEHEIFFLGDTKNPIGFSINTSVAQP